MEKKVWRRLWQVLKCTTLKKVQQRQYDAVWCMDQHRFFGAGSRLTSTFFEVNRVSLCAKIQANAANFTTGHLRVQKGNDLKHNVNAAEEFLKVWKWNILQWPGQWPDLNLILLHFTCLKKRKKIHKHLKTAAAVTWQTHFSAAVRGLQTSDSEVWTFLLLFIMM